MEQTKIGIIREAIQAEGGNYIEGHRYYADGPNSDAQKGRRHLNEVIYKIPKCYDGLTDEARMQVVLRLNGHPRVKEAYLSRKYRQYEGNLKVIFDAG